MKSSTRILAAIMFTDIVGYTAMMQENEEVTKKLRDKHREVVDKTALKFRGSVIQYYGDGNLSIFGSAVEAVNCAVEIQKQLLAEPTVPVRIGLHIGDIVYDDDGVFGDGVNMASRIENMAVAGSVLISDKIHDELESHPDISAVSLGKYDLKNVKRPVEIFAISSKGLFVPDHKTINKERVDNTKSIAVLPFVNMSADKDNEYFSDGITEEILNALAQVSTLRVTSRTSSFAFKGKSTDIREIGKQLNVGYILEGSVRKAGNKVRVTAQLINSTDGYHLWSDVYDRDLEDIFVVQDEISQKITRTLQEKLSDKKTIKHLVKAPTDNMVAYNLLLKGKFHLNKWTPEDASQAIACFKRVLELEPEMAGAYSALSGCYTFLGAIGWKPPLEVFPLAEKYVNIALELDDKLAETHMSLALIKLLYHLDLPGANESFQRALILKPNSVDIKVYYSLYLSAANKNIEAVRQLEAALEIDPLSTSILFSLARVHMLMREYGRAIELAERVRALDQTNRAAYEFIGWCYLFLGNYDKAILCFEEYAKLVANPVKGITGLGYAYAKKGDYKKASEYLEKVKERLVSDKETILDMDLAILYEGLGDLDKTFYHIEKAFKQKMGIIFVKTHPGWDNLRKDPRLEALLSKFGYKE